MAGRTHTLPRLSRITRHMLQQLEGQLVQLLSS